MESALLALQAVGFVAMLLCVSRGLWLIFSGRADQLMAELRRRRKFGLGIGLGGQVPHVDASGFVAIGFLAYGMAQWLLVLLPVYLLLLAVTG